MNSIYKPFLLILLAGLLSGCASERLFRSVMGNWVGQDFEFFHATYGDPDNTEFISDDIVAHQYRISGMRDCTVVWYVDQEDIIVDF